MALIKCKECGGEVSTEAKACPKCGAKVDYKKPMSRVMKLLLGGCGVAVVAGIVTANRQEAEQAQAQAARTPEEIAADKKRNAELQLAALGAGQLKKAMKDPQAFELTGLYVTANGHACYDYRAKNTFGATLPASALLTPDGKMLVSERDGGKFSKAWNRECTQKGGKDITAAVKLLLG